MMMMMMMMGRATQPSSQIAPALSFFSATLDDVGATQLQSRCSPTLHGPPLIPKTSQRALLRQADIPDPINSRRPYQRGPPCPENTRIAGGDLQYLNVPFVRRAGCPLIPPQVGCGEVEEGERERVNYDPQPGHLLL
ncbi:hypothetical protein AOLI_G00306600 [Acnodon oligacanthus]